MRTTDLMLVAMVRKKKFKKTYDKIFKQDPIGANVFLLISELADSEGNVEFKNGPDGTPIQEICDLLQARFNDPEEYAL